MPRVSIFGPSPSDLERRWTPWIAAANDALASRPDAGARWWGFGPPCCTFQLVVGDPVGDNVAIMLTWCDYLAGPTSWSRQSIRISLRPMSDDPSEFEFLLEDARAGFRAEGRTLHWACRVDVVDPRAWLLRWPPGDDRA
jgi:hypothetical protein